MKLRSIRKGIVLIILLLTSIFSLAPFYIMVVMGTQFNEDLFKGIRLIPGHYFMENWKTVMATDFLSYYWNSLYIAVIATIGGTLVSSLAGFAFAKYKFKFRNGLLLLVIGMLAIPYQLGLTGLVMEFKWIDWNNTHFPLIFLPMMNAFAVFWMTQFIGSAIPDEIMESCRMDGCSEFRIYWQIVMPNIGPALVTMLLLIFLGSWNNYLTPMVVLSKDQLYTVPLAISKFNSMYRTDYAAQILALSLSTLPILLLFAVFSKSLIRGLMAGSIKG